MPNLVNSSQLAVHSWKKSVNREPKTVNRRLWRRGFTLIELLVVISIVGILASFVVASMTGAQAKARDSHRKADLDAVKKALELAKADSTGAAFYPSCDLGAATCVLSSSSTNPDLGLQSNPYIKSMPTDPKGGSWTYVYTPTPAAVGTSTDYTIRACLENGNDPDRETTKVTCTATGQNASYAIVNP